MTGQYETPLSSRYASQYMLELFSADTRYRTWRKLWVALAKAEMELGLPVTQEQVDELAAHIDDIDYECVKQREKEVRHDVMAHVYAYGKVAPGAAGIIHLGATSCYVTDNADLVIYRDGLRHLRGALLGAMKSLCDPLPAGAAGDCGQAGIPVAAGFCLRSGGNRLRDRSPVLPGLSGNHRYGSELHGPVRRR